MLPAIDPVTFLPNELSLKIFYYLDGSALRKCCQVHSNWHSLVNDISFWREIAKKFFMIESSKDKVEIKNLFLSLESKQLKSNEDIIKQVEAFINKVSLNQNARFRCIFGLGKGSQFMNIEIKSNSGKPEKIDLKEVYFSKQKIDSSSPVAPTSKYKLKRLSPGSLIQWTKNPIKKSENFTEQRLKIRTTIYEVNIPSGLHFFYNTGPFKGTLEFSSLPEADLSNLTNMERRIKNIIKIKLDSYIDQTNQKIRRQHIILTCLIWCVVLGYVAWSSKLTDMLKISH
jgi:hypothetical protein